MGNSTNGILQVVVQVKPVEIMNSMKGEEMRQEKRNRTRGQRATSKYELWIIFFNYYYYHLAFVFKG